jgi:hypothetical protein
MKNTFYVIILHILDDSSDTVNKGARLRRSTFIAVWRLKIDGIIRPPTLLQVHDHSTNLLLKVRNIYLTLYIITSLRYQNYTFH